MSRNPICPMFVFVSNQITGRYSKCSINRKVNCCALISLKLENNYTDLANFDLEMFVEDQSKLKKTER